MSYSIKPLTIFFFSKKSVASTNQSPPTLLVHRDITSIRRLDNLGMSHPIPGLHILTIDTLGRVYYLAFSKHSVRESCWNAIQNAIFSIEDHTNLANDYNSIPTHDPQESFLLKSDRWARMQNKSGSKTHARLILNARRLSFDDADFMKCQNDKNEINNSICKFMESTLHQALALRPDSPLGSTISFLDMTCNFSSIPVHKLGNGDEALCFFINLYHCLLQHILLLLGPPSKVSCFLITLEKSKFPLYLRMYLILTDVIIFISLC